MRPREVNGGGVLFAVEGFEFVTQSAGLSRRFSFRRLGRGRVWRSLRDVTHTIQTCLCAATAGCEIHRPVRTEFEVGDIERRLRRVASQSLRGNKIFKRS